MADTAEKTAARVEANKQELKGLKLYTLAEIEPIIGVTNRTLLQYIKTGQLKAVKIGHKWKVTEENLRDFVSGSKQSKGTLTE